MDHRWSNGLSSHRAQHFIWAAPNREDQGLQDRLMLENPQNRRRPVYITGERAGVKIISTSCMLICVLIISDFFIFYGLRTQFSSVASEVINMKKWLKTWGFKPFSLAKNANFDKCTPYKSFAPPYYLSYHDNLHFLLKVLFAKGILFSSKQVLK